MTMVIFNVYSANNFALYFFFIIIVFAFIDLSFLFVATLRAHTFLWVFLNAKGWRVMKFRAAALHCNIFPISFFLFFFFYTQLLNHFMNIKGTFLRRYYRVLLIQINIWRWLIFHMIPYNGSCNVFFVAILSYGYVAIILEEILFMMFLNRIIIASMYFSFDHHECTMIV